MYYDLSTEAKSTNSSTSVSLSFAGLYITSEQISIGIIVEIFAFLPSLLLIQFFRRLRPRRPQQSPLRKALYKVRRTTQNENAPNDMKTKTKKRSTLMFPWWCIFIGYGLCLMIVGVSILFIIARGIEFGDLKSQKWLTSILTGFFSSILFTQPIKIIVLAIFFACFCSKSNDENREANEWLDDNSVDLNYDEEYLHEKKDENLFTYRNPIRANRLTENEVISLREERLKEIEMWSMIREIVVYLTFLLFLFIFVYSDRDLNSFLQVNHLRKYFLNTRQENLDFTKISTVDDYWNWLEKSFIKNLRAQKWYNDDPPRNLSGFINDKSNRLIGWATMRQLRVKSELCVKRDFIDQLCSSDYNFVNEDRNSY
ncbi:unnamed protein product, partial [Adineta ricciae]